MRNRPYKERIYLGLKLNRLTAVDYDHTSEYDRIKIVKGKPYKSKSKFDHWNFICDCGNTTTTSLKDFFNSQSKSCGCLQKEIMLKILVGRPSPTKGKGNYNDTAFNNAFLNYKIGAKKRDYSFSLTKPEFKTITLQNCNYCGIEPSNKCNEQTLRGSYIYNGIDRVDNNIGYEVNNCVPCCFICNKAKSILSKEDFNIWLSRIVNFNKHLINE